MRKRWLSTLHECAVVDPRIVFVGSDLTADPAMLKLREAIGDRFFMEGISEALVVGMASGLAVSGFRVYVNTIATFLTRRCFEQNSIDLGLANANVRLIGGGGGLVYAPLGPTHLATEDIALMRAIPNMCIIAPSDADQMDQVIRASVDWQGPIYIRVAKGGEPAVPKPNAPFVIGRSIVHQSSEKVLLVTYGTMVHTCLEAAKDLRSQDISTGVLEVPTLKPLDIEGILREASQCQVLLTVEEHVINGGLGSMVAEIVAETRSLRHLRFRRLGLPDVFPDIYGSQDSLKQRYGLSKDNILETVKFLLR